MRLARGRATLTAAATAILALCAPNPARADDRAEKIIKRITAASAAARTLTADLVQFREIGPNKARTTGTVRLKKPNLALVTMKEAGFSQTFASNGRDVIILMPQNQYFKMPADPKGKNIASIIPVQMFFDPASGLTLGGSAPARYAGKQTVAGRTYDVLDRQISDATIRYFVDSSGLVTRTLIDVKQGSKTFHLGTELTNVRVNARVRAADLAFHLPAGAKLFKQPDYNAKLIPVGKLAEKFDLISLKGDRLTLDDAARGKKAVLVNFWFYG